MPFKNIVTGQKINPVKLQRACELRQEMTLEENVLWQVLRRGNLGGFHFRRQQIISGYIVDFYCHAANLVVEVDGDIHLAQKEYDTDRDKALSGLGLRILHIRNMEIKEHLSDVLKIILSACSEIGPNPRPLP